MQILMKEEGFAWVINVFPLTCPGSYKIQLTIKTQLMRMSKSDIGFGPWPSIQNLENPQTPTDRSFLEELIVIGA